MFGLGNIRRYFPLTRSLEAGQDLCLRISAPESPRVPTDSRARLPRVMESGAGR